MAKKKPHWPIWVTIILLLGCAAILLIDWERYPRAAEMERYLKAQHKDVDKVLITKVEENKDGYEEAQIYYIEYTYADGRIEEHVYTIKAKDRRPVYPWHFYYSDKM